MKGNKKEKHKYGIWDNICYMIVRAWRDCKLVLVFIFLWVGMDMAIHLLQLYIVPTILDQIEAQVPLKQLIKTILFFTWGLILSGAIRAYVTTNQIFGRITVRKGIVMDIHDKINCTSYSNLEDQHFIRLREKARQSTDGNSEATEAIWDTLTDLFRNSLGFLIYLFVLLKVHFLLVIVTILTALAGYLLTTWANQWNYRKEKEHADLCHKLGYISERIRNHTFAKDIRVFGMKNWLSELYQNYFKKLYCFYFHQERVYLGSDLAEVALHFLQNGIAYGYLVHCVLQGSIRAAEFLLYFSAVSGFASWVTGILSSMAVLHRQSLDISLVREFLEYKEPFRFEDGAKLEPVKGETYEISLQQVCFRYPEAAQNTLDQINLTIHKGEKLALVGLNGAGKTTLIKLICGFYEPTEGQILINGQDIRPYNRRDYYRHFSAVFQDFSLFAGSIAVNVAQTDCAIDMEKVRKSIELAGLKEKVESLPQGYQTHLCKEVYEDAVELSGGEMQRLMLARALYKDAPIIILDEPTAALDPLVESDLYQRYHELTQGCTSVYISHRLASTRFCDRVILLDKGRILEEGTHENLLAAGGKYAYLYQMQSQYYQEQAN